MSRKTKRRHRVSLGWHELGNHKVLVSYNPKEAGGHFTAHAMSIGGASGDWHNVVGILLHEAMEKAFGDVCARFIPTPDFAQASDGYLFVASHAQFSEASARAGAFVAGVVPALSRAFRAAKVKT